MRAEQAVAATSGCCELPGRFGARSMAAAIAQLSGRLTDAILQVELQRSTLEEVILRLAEQASHLNGVAGVLTEASNAQGTVLHDLQRLVNSTGVGSNLGQTLPAADGIGRAAVLLDAAATGMASGQLGSAAACTSSPTEGGNPDPHVMEGRPASDSLASIRSQPESVASQSQSSWGEETSRSPSPVTPATPAPAGAISTMASLPPAETRQRSVTMPVRQTVPARAPVIEPDMGDEGIEYVKGLHITGASKMHNPNSPPTNSPTHP